MERFLSPAEILLLDISRDIELVNEEIYLWFADLFRESGKMRSLFLKTAQEEHNHAEQLSLAARLRTSMIETVNLDFDEAKETLNFVRLLLNRIKSNPPASKDALELVIGLEEKLAKFHMDCMVGFADETFRELFRAMMAADKYHLEALQDAYDAEVASVR